MEGFNNEQFLVSRDNARERISKMSEEQVKKILEFAQSPSDITRLSGEDRLVINLICQGEAKKQIGNMTEKELSLKQKELWDKHVQHCSKGTQQLTPYELELLSTVEHELRNLQKTTDQKNGREDR